MSIEQLKAAKTNKADEFYTEYEDIQKEVQYYNWEGISVFCPCDNPEESNFWKFFKDCYYELGLKELRATWLGSDVELIYTDGIQQSVKHNWNTPGDFRETLKLIRDSRVVTNPPFSPFSEFVQLLVQSECEYLVLGNQNAITYKDIFPLIKGNKMWLGVSIHNGDRRFRVPDSYSESQKYEYESGHKYVRVRGPRWFTNIDHEHRYDGLKQKTIPHLDATYQKYDNYSAKEVSKSVLIPGTQDIFGVPITFMDKYSPLEFSIIGATESEGVGLSAGLWTSKPKQAVLNGKKLYKRIFVRRNDMITPQDTISLNLTNAELLQALSDSQSLLSKITDRKDLHGRDPLERYNDILIGRLSELAVIKWFKEHNISVQDQTQSSYDKDLTIQSKFGPLKVSVKSSLSYAKELGGILENFVLASKQSELVDINIQVYFWLRLYNTPRCVVPSVQNAKIIGWCHKNDVKNFTKYNGEDRESVSVKLKELRTMESLLTELGVGGDTERR